MWNRCISFAAQLSLVFGLLSGMGTGPASAAAQSSNRAQSAPAFLDDDPPDPQIVETAEQVFQGAPGTPSPGLTDPSTGAEEPPFPAISGWSSFMTQDFEGAFTDWNTVGNGVYWGKDDYNPHVGSYSAWAAKSGTSGLDPQFSDYPNGAVSWMIYGPFSLVDSLESKLSFYYWNQSELNADYFKWMASREGSVFYGYQASGNSGGWNSIDFDLTAVPALGDLSGDDSVWIAFYFTSNASIQGKGPFVDDIVLQVNTLAATPDLMPYSPAGWDFPIVPSSAAGTHTVDTLNTEQTYIDTAVVNNGAATPASFTNCLYFDGSQLNCWVNPGLGRAATSAINDTLLIPLPTLGNHTLSLVADVNNSVAEADETNNTWQRTFTWTNGCPASSYSPLPDGAEPTILNDAFPLPNEIHERIEEMSAAPSADPLPHSPGRYETSAYLQDSVAVGIVLPESQGSMENWIDSEKSCVVSKIQAGMEWWKNRGGARANLSFVYDLQLGIPTAYEPIDLSDTNANLWINQTLTFLGYTGSDYWEKAYNYLSYLRDHYHTKWAMIYFVADSSNDADGKFKNSSYFAWAYLGGPFVIMTYDNDGWGIDDMNWVAAHEFGHIFGAGDQYYQTGYGGCTSTTQKYGYLGIANSNCQYGNPSSVPSLMRSNEDALEASAQGQIGWRDSNANSINDVVDTTPVFNLDLHTPDPTDESTLAYTGFVFDQPWLHAVCGGSDYCQSKDITINTISDVTYRVDGGDWMSVTPTDGAFDTDVEQISFTTGTLSGGTHTIEVQAVNSVNRTAAWTDTVTTTGCYSLTTAANPPYSGSVSVLTPPNCGSLYAQDTLVEITAQDNSGYTFTTWSGDLGVTDRTASISMTANKSVTANYQNNSPTLLSLNPITKTAGENAFTLTLTGTDFVQSSVARWNGNDLVTTYQDSTHLTASIPASLIVSAGTADISVLNPAPGGGASASITFTINNPAPSLTGISPTHITAGSSGFSLTVTGTDFISASKVRWNEIDLATTYQSETELTASVPASLIASNGSVSITVYNPVPGGGTSGSLVFTIENPTPALISINPTTVIAGSNGFSLTVDGQNFLATSKVRWNGNDLDTVYVDSTQLTASVPAGLILTAGTASITIYNLSPGGGTSENITFQINNPVPSLTSISPTHVNVGSSGFTLSVDGTNFLNSSKIRWNGNNLTTTYLDSTHLTAAVPAGWVAAPGTADITVYNPLPGGGASSSITFSINNPLPGITQVEPGQLQVGQQNQTIHIEGVNFMDGSIALWNGIDLVTTYIDANTLTAAVPDGYLSSAGEIDISVRNPTPGGGTSPVFKLYVVDNWVYLPIVIR